jgi:hypothetical protein
VVELVYTIDLKSIGFGHAGATPVAGTKLNAYQAFIKFCDTWPLETSCWIWPYNLNENGYPYAIKNGKHILLHRESFRLFNGKLEPIDIVRHSCDTPACFNPDHLFKGTHNDNVQDRVFRKRSAIGEYNGRAKLTEEEVLEIFHSEHNYNYLAWEYKVDRKNIVHIKTKKTWKYLTKDL